MAGESGSKHGSYGPATDFPDKADLLKKNEGLITSLRRNARVSISEISKQTKIPQSTLFDSLHSLEEAEVLRHISLLDFEKAGFHSQVFLGLKTCHERRLDLKDFLVAHQSINSIYRVDGGLDFVVEAVFPSQLELAEFVEVLEAKNVIVTKQVWNILDVVRKEMFLTGNRENQVSRDLDI